MNTYSLNLDIEQNYCENIENHTMMSFSNRGSIPYKVSYISYLCGYWPNMHIKRKPCCHV
jgi:hypothetical protein